MCLHDRITMLQLSSNSIYTRMYKVGALTSKEGLGSYFTWVINGNLRYKSLMYA